MANKRKISASARAGSTPKQEASEQLTGEHSQDEQPELPQYKDDSNAFNIPVEDEKDYISGLPSEIVDRILGYCVMDHEPELAVRQKAQGSDFIRNPHALLSLAAMSKHFKAHVESFCRRELMRNREIYRLFKTNAEIVQKGGLRRSPRVIAQLPVDNRCYRSELVKDLQAFCIQCMSRTETFATMANSVKCHASCEHRFFPGVIDLSTALRKYDLRDWMLIKTRQPGPRAKKTDLPTIQYGTVRCGTPICVGRVISYRFYEKDVEAIAKLVHGDVDEHMTAKNEQRTDRRNKKRRLVHRELKVRYHADLIEIFDLEEDREDREYHQRQLEYYTGPDWDEDGNSDVDEYEYAYGDYDDVHRRLCVNKHDFCDYCWDATFYKYHGW